MAKPLALIIEDQANLAMLYEDALRLVGYDIFSLNDGLKALNHLETNNPPDLVILDVNLPNLSGKDIHRHIRGSQKYADTPVIILTANSLMIEQMHGVIGENDHLFVKPIGMRQLQELAKSLRRDKEGTPSFMADTQKVPHLEEGNAEEEETKTKTNPPTILRPDNSVMESSEQATIAPTAQIQERKTIITPEDSIIEPEDAESGAAD